MTDKEIRAKRKQLESELSTCMASYYRVNSNDAVARGEHDRATAAVARCRTEIARGVKGVVDLDAAKEQERAAAENVEELKAQGDAVYAARKELERQIDTLLANHFETFAEAASKRSDAAEEAVRIVEKAALRAENLWREAQEAWRPLCRATSIAAVPPFPLSRAGVIPARPPSVSRVESAA